MLKGEWAFVGRKEHRLRSAQQQTKQTGNDDSWDQGDAAQHVAQHVAQQMNGAVRVVVLLPVEHSRSAGF